jgi:hypothetical protein
LDGPHETIESAKAAFQITYREQFGVQWEERETTVSGKLLYSVRNTFILRTKCHILSVFCLHLFNPNRALHLRGQDLRDLRDH